MTIKIRLKAAAGLKTEPSRAANESSATVVDGILLGDMATTPAGSIVIEDLKFAIPDGQSPFENACHIAERTDQAAGALHKSSLAPELTRWARLFVTAALVILTMVAVQLASGS